MSSRSLTWRRVGVGAVAVATVAAGSPLLLSSAANAAGPTTRLTIAQENGRSTAAAGTCTAFTVTPTDAFGGQSDPAIITVTLAEVATGTVTMNESDVDFCLVDGGSPFRTAPQYQNEPTETSLRGTTQRYDAGPSITTVPADSPPPPSGSAAAGTDNPDEAGGTSDPLDPQVDANNNNNPSGTDLASFQSNGSPIRFGVVGIPPGGAATVDAFFDTDGNLSRNNDADEALEDNVVAQTRTLNLTAGGVPGSTEASDAVETVVLEPENSVAAKASASGAASHGFSVTARNSSGDLVGGVGSVRLIATSGPNAPSSSNPNGSFGESCTATGNEGEPATCIYTATQEGTDVVTAFVNQTEGQPTFGLDSTEPRDTGTAKTVAAGTVVSPSATPTATMSPTATPTATMSPTATPTATISPGAGQTEAGSRYRGLASPVRVLDTRNNRGSVRSGPIVLDLSQRITDPNATSAVLNVTVTNATRRGFLVAYPNNTDKPETSNVNFERNQTQANEVVVRLGSDRRVVLFVDSASAHVIADLVGSFTTSTGSGVGEATTNSPVRAFDSRNTATPVRRNEVVVDLTGRIPSGSTDAILNVTVTRTTARGFVTVFPTGTDRPGTSNVNFEARQTQANEVITRVGTGSNANRVSFFIDSASAALVVDVVGAVSTTADGQTFTALASPQRALDTRDNRGTPRSGNINLVLPSSVPANATGAILNVTATNGTRPGFVTVFPGGSTNPGTSNVNFPTNLTQANEVTTGLGPNNNVTLFVGGGGDPSAHVIVDVVGYLTD